MRERLPQPSRERISLRRSLINVPGTVSYGISFEANTVPRHPAMEYRSPVRLMEVESELARQLSRKTEEI